MDKYEVLEHVGKGSFGAVTKIKRKSDSMLLVWKEINYGKMKEKEKQQLVSEVNILRELRHPNIVKYYDRIIDKPHSKLFIVMEYCEKGDLGQLIKKCNRDKDFLSEDVIWKIFMQVLLALQACHHREAGKILHRDIKPGNVLLDSNMNVKLGDFGLSRILGENSIYAETSVGTPYYMSPEQISDSRYNEKSDIWSAGCLLFEMASLSPPFRAKTHAELAQKIHLGQTDRIPLRYSEELQRVISWMLAIDSNLRPSVNDILNLPQINLRIKEKKNRDETQRLKDLEAKIQERENKAQKEQEDLKKREQDLIRKEKLFTEKTENSWERTPERHAVEENSWEKRLQKIEEIRKEAGLRSKEEKVSEEPSKLKLKDNTFDYLSGEAEKNLIRRENTMKEVAVDSIVNVEIKREKSFENLVQEGFERVKRDSNMIKGLEHYSKASPNKIVHNSSAPDIPKARASPSANREPPAPAPARESPYSVKTYKESLEKEKTSYNIYKEIEERYKNRTSPLNTSEKSEPTETPRFERRDSGEIKRTENRIPPSNFYNRTPPTYKNADSPARPYDKQDSPLSRYVKKEFPPKTYEKREPPLSNLNYKRDSPSTYSPSNRPETKPKIDSNAYQRPFEKRESPQSNLNYRRDSPTSYPIGKTESPGIRKETSNSKIQYSPKVPRTPVTNSPGFRHADSAGKLNRDSPGYYRRNTEPVRKESPRYAEPIRKNSREYSAERKVTSYRSNSLEKRQGKFNSPSRGLY